VRIIIIIYTEKILWDKTRRRYATRRLHILYSDVISPWPVGIMYIGTTYLHTIIL